MGKYGCKDVSTLLVDTKKRETKPRKPAREPKDLQGRVNSAKVQARVEDAAHAKKKKEIQDEVHLERILAKEEYKNFKVKRQTHVWVGNLQPSMTEPRLAAMFSRKCGRVVSVELRRSGGQAVTKGQDIPDKSENDTLYASVHFAKHESAKKALLYDEALVDNHKIVVAAEPVRMPEQLRILEEQKKRQQERFAKSLGPNIFGDRQTFTPSSEVRKYIAPSL